MGLQLDIRNESRRTRLYRRDGLLRLADRILAEEDVGPDVVLSVLFCDDPLMTHLNRRYRKKNGPTDVLAFGQAQAPTSQAGKGERRAPRVLGDIVISLETVTRNCGGDRAAMRQEVRMLFCHGMLHLLGYSHGTVRELERMTVREAHYLAKSTMRGRRRQT